MKSASDPAPTSAPAQPPSFNTVGKIARDLGVPVSRVSYILQSRQIPCSAKAGIYRLFDRDAVLAVRRELADIDARSQRRAMK